MCNCCDKMLVSVCTVHIVFLVRKCTLHIVRTLKRRRRIVNDRCHVKRQEGKFLFSEKKIPFKNNLRNFHVKVIVYLCCIFLCYMLFLCFFRCLKAIRIEEMRRCLWVSEKGSSKSSKDKRELRTTNNMYYAVLCVFLFVVFIQQQKQKNKHNHNTCALSENAPIVQFFGFSENTGKCLFCLSILFWTYCVRGEWVGESARESGTSGGSCPIVGQLF